MQLEAIQKVVPWFKDCLLLVTINNAGLFLYVSASDLPQNHPVIKAMRMCNSYSIGKKDNDVNKVNEAIKEMTQLSSDETVQKFDFYNNGPRGLKFIKSLGLSDDEINKIPELKKDLHFYIGMLLH